MPDSNYDLWAGRYVHELATLAPPAITAAEVERHTIFSLALMAITRHYWNGNKNGRGLLYPLNAPAAAGDIGAGDYLGHNIAALAVDADGDIIDFDFNHNDLFASSVEHAESRLLRRLFSLTSISDGWALGGSPIQDRGYASRLREVTLYTTLESCAQCSGIMALAQLKQVVFLQTDPGQYHVGAIMRNMTLGSTLQAPAPIPGSALGLDVFDRLDAAYQAFRVRPADAAHAFVLAPDGSLLPGSPTTSITSFLCTKAARDIYEDAAAQFSALKVTAENAGVLLRAVRFVEYATKEGRRGTPHRA